jgi:hypothetical protein
VIAETAIAPFERSRLLLPCQINDPKCNTWYHSWKHASDYPNIMKRIAHESLLM